MSGDVFYLSELPYTAPQSPPAAQSEWPSYEHMLIDAGWRQLAEIKNHISYLSRILVPEDFAAYSAPLANLKKIETGMAAADLALAGLGLTGFRSQNSLHADIEARRGHLSDYATELVAMTEIIGRSPAAPQPFIEELARDLSVYTSKAEISLPSEEVTHPLPARAPKDGFAEQWLSLSALDYSLRTYYGKTSGKTQSVIRHIEAETGVIAGKFTALAEAIIAAQADPEGTAVATAEYEQAMPVIIHSYATTILQLAESVHGVLEHRRTSHEDAAVHPERVADIIRRLKKFQVGAPVSLHVAARNDQNLHAVRGTVGLSNDQ